MGEGGLVFKYSVMVIADASVWGRLFLWITVRGNKLVVN